MKKTKLLMPILATAGLGCAMVPMITLVSCSEKRVITLDRETQFTKDEWAIDISGWKKGTCTCKFEYQANDFTKTHLCVVFEDSNKDYLGCITSVTGKMTTNGEVKTLVFTNNDEGSTKNYWLLTEESEKDFDIKVAHSFEITINYNSDVSKAKKLIITSDI